MEYSQETNIYQTDAIADGINNRVNQYDEYLDQMVVFNKLTNNAADQGLFIEDGKVYLNATMIKAGYLSADYIRGGTLELGGAGDQNGNIKMYDIDGNVIGSWGVDGFENRKGDEWIRMRESVLWGGYGGTMDGCLDLSAQIYTRDVILDAYTGYLILRSQTSNVYIWGNEIQIARASDNYMGHPVLTDTSGDSAEIRRAYIATSGSSRYLYLTDGNGNTYRTSALTAV